MATSVTEFKHSSFFPLRLRKVHGVPQRYAVKNAAGGTAHATSRCRHYETKCNTLKEATPDSTNVVTWRSFWEYLKQANRKAMGITNSHCVCSLYPACNEQCAILSSVACPALQNFSTLSYKRHDFRKKRVIEHKMCMFWFSLQLSSEKFLILRRIQRGITMNIRTFSCKLIVIHVIF